MDQKFNDLVEYVTVRINKVTGNVFDETTRSMVITRLNRRILELKLNGPEEYLEILESKWNQEEQLLIGLLTTHHTFFFREIVHFEFIQENIEKIISDVLASGRNKIKIWSAAASKGQEAYSLAFMFNKLLAHHKSNIEFEIYATDIDQGSVDFGAKGVYPYTEVKEIPSMFLHGNWEKNKKGDFARVKDSIRKKITFATGNLLESSSSVDKFDIVFCRNVLIYFDSDTVTKVVTNLEKRLEPNGFLFTGVSEPIGESTKNLKRVGPCIYGRESTVEVVSNIEEKKKPFRIVNCDDSPTVLKVLKKIFEGDERFEIVGQCENGQALSDYLDVNTDVDLITLDLHMPVMDGVSYLESRYNNNHPPVIVLSSVNRENKELGEKAVQLGAEDYIEKPNFKNFQECGDQLKTKIISLLSFKSEANKNVNNDNSVQKKEESKKKYVLDSFHQTDSIKRTVELKHQSVHLVYPPIEKMDALFSEILSEGIFPEVFVLPTQKHIDEFQSYINSFLASYEFKGGRPEFQFFTKLKYLQTFSNSYTDPGIAFCFYRGSEVLDHLNEKINENSYVLSEDSFECNGVRRESMPCTSWGFHIIEFLEQTVLQYQKVLPWDDYKDTERVLPLGHQMIVLMKGNDHLAFYLNDDLRSGLSTFKEVLDNGNGRYDGFKYIGERKNSRTFLNLCRLSGLKAHKLFEALTPVKFKLSSKGVMLKRIKGAKIETLAIQDKKESEIVHNKVKVLVIDDSPTMTKVISRYLEKDTNVECVGIHHDIKNLENSIVTKKPDVITLDMNMPEMTGDLVFQNIIKKHEIPTILLTSMNPDAKKVIMALNYGVWDYLQKPSMKEFSESKDLIEKIKLAKGSQKRVIQQERGGFRLQADFNEQGYILIGSSTGGTKAIGTMLKTFPTKFPPVLICQHIPEHFSRSLAELLDETNPFLVKELEDGEVPQPNTVYICKGGVHAEFKMVDEEVKVIYKKDVPDNKFIPSVDHFFLSFSKLGITENTVASILTGMGKDGVKGMMALRKNGVTTMSQDQATSVVYGMPRVAFESGASMKQVALDDMASTVLKNFKKTKASA